MVDYSFWGLALAGTGGCAGVLAGLFGIGGGIIIVPVLYSLLCAGGVFPDVAMHVAVGTSLATILPTGLSSARAHWRRGAVSRDALRLLVPGAVVGAVLGAAAAGVLRGEVLVFVFAGFTSFFAVLMLRGQKGVALVKDLPRGGLQHGIGGVIGFVSALVGIGGGLLTVPTLSACGTAMTLAVGTGSAVGVSIALPGALGFMVTGWGVSGLPPYSLGYVNLPAFALIASFSVLCAPVGARLAHHLPTLWLQRGFAAMMLLVALKMIMTA